MIKNIELSSGQLSVSKLVWGIWRIDQKEKEVSDVLKYCLDHGINTIDSADIYGAGACEVMLGKALKKLNINRKEIKLISKCGIVLGNKDKSVLKHYDYSEKHILSSLNRSLKAFNTDYLDLLLYHRPSPLMDIDQVAKTTMHLYESGKVRFFGVSNFSPSQFALLQSRLPIPLITNQIEISLYTLSPFLNGAIDFMYEREICPMAWSPLGGGKLFDPRYKALHQVAKSINPDAPLACVLLAFLLKHPAHIVPVIGSTRIEGIKNAIEALKIELSDEQWFKLWVSMTNKNVP